MEKMTYSVTKKKKKKKNRGVGVPVDGIGLVLIAVSQYKHLKTLPRTLLQQQTAHRLLCLPSSLGQGL